MIKTKYFHLFLILNLQILLLILVNEINAMIPKNSMIDNYVVVSLKNDNNYEDAFKIAKRNGYKVVKKIDGFTNVFLLEKVNKKMNIKENYHENIENFLKKRSENLSVNLNDEDDVLWASQQHLLKRSKRDFPIYITNEIDHYLDYQNILYYYRPFFNDELWDQQWYMFKQKSSNYSGNKEILGLNVIPVYEKGISGKGVRVAVLDDGLEYDHDDLIQNYDPEISWNCNNDNSDPYPSKMKNHHGTRCAGEIAMIANNKKCGVGIAFNAKIGCIKLLDGEVYDLIEGIALGYAYNKIDIYSCSWGPTDDGKTLEKPGIFAYNAIKRGINEGRNGLGSIYVWASGNGGKNYDNCNCDGYAGSIYTIAVGSVSQNGDIPWYSERCSSLMTVTYSSGTTADQMITTTDIGNSCTIKHTGTSASAPLAAGIIALGLEVNPYLTWRDVQHIIVRSSEYLPLYYHKNWFRNSAGYYFNLQFGFGLMNAGNFVNLAETWQTIPEQLVDSVESINDKRLKKFVNRGKQYFMYKTNRIKYLEHVEVTVNINCQIRGSIEISLISPSGSNVRILESRIDDKSIETYKNWTLMSVATWSENPNGKWILIIRDVNGNKTIENFYKSKLTLYGTNYLP